jgi:enoyl-CoA hydratase/carnithine racemase
MSNNNSVLFERLDKHVAVVTLNRPAARNAVNGEVAQQLEALVDLTEADSDIRVTILTSGDPAVFSAGADLKEVAAGRRSSLRTERGGFAGFVFAQRSKPWIAAVEGKALAGGLELVLACDLIVASQNSLFGLPEVKRSLIAAAGGLHRLRRRLPYALALEMLLTGDPISASHAHQAGLLNALVEPGACLREAHVLAKRIAINAPLAVRDSLRIARASDDMSEYELRLLGSECLARLALTDDYKEGPRAFIEKREPNGTGS